MPRNRIFIVVATMAVMGTGAVVLGSFMPSEFLGGINRPFAVTLLGTAPVLLVAVAVGCVLAYRWAVRAVFSSHNGKQRSSRRRSR